MSRRLSSCCEAFGWAAAGAALGRLAIALAVILVLIVATAAWPAPPPDADPQLAPFFQGLQAPNGASCCSLSDCRVVTAKVGPKGWLALVKPNLFPGATEEKWVEVPNEKVLHNKSAPKGVTTMCWSPYLGVMCFTEPPMS